MINKKPVIGLIAKHDEDAKQRPISAIRDEVKNALLHNGGIPIGLICPMKTVQLVDDTVTKTFSEEEIENFITPKEKQQFIEMIQMCDGIVLSGGRSTDAYEIWVCKYCYENDIPFLAICAGQNNIARALGGSVKAVEDREKHICINQQYAHNVFIDKNSFFYDIVKTEKMKVNSRHRYTVNSPGILSVCGRDDYGNIEIVEAKDKKYFISMRFHPESLYDSDKNHNLIFERFIDVCKKRTD